MKSLSFDHLSLNKSLPEHEYEHLVSETAKMLGMPYIAVHKMVETWGIQKIRERLHEATHHNGQLQPRVFWFWRRKQDKK
jgi:hypothetical protein